MREWPQAILEAVIALDNVILVAHSRGGMFALSLPELEQHLKGLVLLDSAPDNGWQQLFASHIEHHPLPELEKAEHIYKQSPSNESLKEFVIAGAPYMFT
jgi:pimeloyl-ACP methyl ester carboxylesterase